MKLLATLIGCLLLSAPDDDEPFKISFDLVSLEKKHEIALKNRLNSIKGIKDAKVDARSRFAEMTVEPGATVKLSDLKTAVYNVGKLLKIKEDDIKLGGTVVIVHSLYTKEKEIKSGLRKIKNVSRISSIRKRQGAFKLRSRKGKTFLLGDVRKVIDAHRTKYDRKGIGRQGRKGPEVKLPSGLTDIEWTAPKPRKGRRP